MANVLTEALEKAQYGEQVYSFEVPDEEFNLKLSLEHVTYRGKECYDIGLGAIGEDGEIMDGVVRILIEDEFAEYLAEKFTEDDMKHVVELMNSEIKRTEEEVPAE